MAAISAISNAPSVDDIRPAGAARAGGGFQEALTSAIQSVDGMRQSAAASVNRFLSGEGEELHTTLLATTEAQLAFNLFLQGRNKVVSAYQEIMRMQV